MDYETEEQQVEALKAWWAENGKAVIAGVLLGAGAIGGWRFWEYRQETLAVAASDSFSQAMEAVEAGDTGKVLSLADALQDDQPGSLYSAYTNLAAARASVENEDLADAAARLAWVAENAPQADVQMIARVRLARLQGALGEATKGLSTLPDDVPEAFVGLVEEARGDLLLLTGDRDNARAAYELAQASQYVANRQGLAMKLNELALPSSAEDDADSTS